MSHDHENSATGTCNDEIGRYNGRQQDETSLKLVEPQAHKSYSFNLLGDISATVCRT